MAVRGLFFLVFTTIANIACGQETVESSVTLIDRTDPVVYEFSEEEELLLDNIQRGCFNFFWKEVGAKTGLVKDNLENIVSNLGGVGFQLSSLPIGVERGWIDRKSAERRTLQILHSLRDRRDNRREGIHLHFVIADTGDVHLPYRTEASTVDHSLLLAGAITAASYFGGEVAEIVDQIALQSNWQAFLSPEDGFLSMGWRPTDNKTMSGTGSLIPNTWRFASDEERIIYFLAAGAPNETFALLPRSYYSLGRPVKSLEKDKPFVPSWNGIPFNYFFSHCWIDYRHLEADNPGQFGVEAPRVDWFENSRRAILAHRQRCIEVANQYKTFSPERWGVSSCMGFNPEGKRAYLVQQVQPNIVGQDQWRMGTIAPYAAGGSIMFTPDESMAALRALRDLKDKEGKLLVWRDPAKGGYGFVDSFNLDQGLVMEDNLAIDQGPMLLAIENARTGLIWKLFMEHDYVKRCRERLRLTDRE